MASKFVIKNIPHNATEEEVSELHADIQGVVVKTGHAIVTLSPEANGETFISQLNDTKMRNRKITVVKWEPRAKFKKDSENFKPNFKSDDSEGDRGRSSSRGPGPRGRSKSRPSYSGPRIPRIVEVRGSGIIAVGVPSVSEFIEAFEYAIRKSKSSKKEEEHEVTFIEPASGQNLVGCGTYDPALLVLSGPKKTTSKKFKVVTDSTVVIHKRTLGCVSDGGEVMVRKEAQEEVQNAINTIKSANIPIKNLIFMRFEGEGVLTSIGPLKTCLVSKFGYSLEFGKIYQLSLGGQELPVFKFQRWPEEDEY